MCDASSTFPLSRMPRTPRFIIITVANQLTKYTAVTYVIENAKHNDFLEACLIPPYLSSFNPKMNDTCKLYQQFNSKF